MKRILTIMLALMLTLSSVLPAVAADVPTTVTINGGGSGAPLVKAKWEQDLTTSLENGDPTHLTAGSQFLPPLIKNAKKPIQYWAIVTDPDGANTIAGVTVDVFHPNNSPAPYNANNFFKYQIILQKVDQATGLAAYIKARDAKLVTFQQNTTPPINDAEILMELDKGTAYVYMGQQDIDYEQPAGLYTVKVDAWDTTNAYAGQATPPLNLINEFRYVAVNGIEVDFSVVNYGSVAVSSEKWIAGDTIWQTPVGPAPAPNPATVRNIGNTWVKITVKQNDMGFGFSGVTGTAYSGPTPPAAGQSNWNVVFDARMGSNPANAMYYDPNVQITLPNVLTLSNQDELDFSIHVIKSPSGSKVGQMIIGSVAVPFP